MAAHTSVSPGRSAQFLFGFIESCLPQSCLILGDAWKMPGFLKTRGEGHYLLSLNFTLSSDYIDLHQKAS